MNRVLSSGFGPSSYPSPSDIRSNSDPLPPAVQMTEEPNLSCFPPLPHPLPPGDAPMPQGFGTVTVNLAGS